MKAALYARYSSHEQDGGESIDFQLRKGREYNDLKATLEFATPEERKNIVLENVVRIEVSKNGKALMEANPEGLLSELLCVDMVTPRGVEPPLPE